MKKTLYLLFVITTFLVLSSCGMIKSYNVKFLQDDETTELYSYKAQEGSSIEYGAAIPTKAEDDKNTYVFAGWDHALGTATKDETFVAQYTAVPKNGSTPALGGNTPTPSSTTGGNTPTSTTGGTPTSTTSGSDATPTTGSFNTPEIVGPNGSDVTTGSFNTPEITGPKDGEPTTGGNNTSAQENITITFSGVETEAYVEDKSFTIGNYGFKANILYAENGGNNGTFVRVGSKGNKLPNIPAKFGMSGKGGSLEMTTDVENATGVTFNVGAQMTGSTVSNWTIFVSTNGGSSWTSIGSGTSINGSISANMTSAATARFALVITGDTTDNKGPRLDLVSMVVTVSA